MFKPREFNIKICFIVFMEWSLPLIIWVTLSSISSTKFDKINVGFLSDLAIEKSSIFFDGILTLPKIKSSYEKWSLSLFTLNL